MKKTIVFISALILAAGLTFGQSPQTPAKTNTATKTETKTTTTPTKDPKAGCDPKMAKDCPASKSCCTHGKAAPAPEKKEEAKPEKK
jgi:hypothetical protein